MRRLEDTDECADAVEDLWLASYHDGLTSYYL